MDMKAVVVGGGIAGLASAIGLRKQGWDVEVLERAPAFTEVGAGLSLWPNALNALDALGVGEIVRERSVLDGSTGIRDERGRWLSRTDVAVIRERFGHIALVHRATLLDILRAAAATGVPEGRGGGRRRLGGRPRAEHGGRAALGPRGGSRRAAQHRPSRRVAVLALAPVRRLHGLALRDSSPGGRRSRRRVLGPR